MRPPPPAERVRRRLGREVGGAAAAGLPRGYERIGRVLLLRLPEGMRPHFGRIGRLWQEELGVETVLRRAGPIVGELRHPQIELLAGEGTETEVVEHGVRYAFDAAEVMFARGNKEERARAGRLVRPGEVVADLFAGIGYFAVPAALPGRAARVEACEKNPVALRYLARNVERNGVSERVRIHPGDNREAPLGEQAFDRVFLGLLPSGVPFVRRALPLLRPDGGWLHVHLAPPAHGALERAAAAVAEAIGREDGEILASSAREVKPYGPGRTHVVVDAFARPASR